MTTMKDLDRKMRERYCQKEDDRLMKLEENKWKKIDKWKKAHYAEEKDGEDDG